MKKLAVVGATGLVGRTVLKVLEEKNLPINEYVLFSSKKSAGSTIHFLGKDYLVDYETLTIHFNNRDDSYLFFTYSVIISINVLYINELIKQIFHLK